MHGREIFEPEESKQNTSATVYGQNLTKETPPRPATTNKPVYKPPPDKIKRNNRDFKKSKKSQKEPPLELSDCHRQISEIIDIPQTKSCDPGIDQFNLCTKCQCYVPPRAHHCKRCNRCVLRRDHHCTWLGSCIGFYNYKFFILFLYYAPCLLGLVISSIIQRVSEGPKEYFWIYVAFLALSVPEFCILVALCFFHTALLARNMTSLEKMKHPTSV